MRPLRTLGLLLGSILLSSTLSSAPVRADDGAVIDAGLIDHSLALCVDYLLAQQRPGGDFNVAYRWVDDDYPADEDRAVRQALSLWGLAQAYRQRPDNRLALALTRGFRFFDRLSSGADGMRFINYPGVTLNFTGVQAVVTLALIDYLRSARPDSAGYADYRRMLEDYLGGLLRQQAGGVFWFKGYHGKNSSPDGNYTAFSSGPSLLAFLRAAKYLGYEQLREPAEASAEAGYRHFVRAALKKNRNAKITRQYYLWAMLSYYELADGPEQKKWSERAFELADWMIDERKVSTLKGNTIYAVEGILLAGALAKWSGDVERAERYAAVARAGLRKAISWQVGSRLQNEFIQQRDPASRPAALGGVQLRADRPLLLTSVTQHLLHALLLARRHLPAEQ